MNKISSEEVCILDNIDFSSGEGDIMCLKCDTAEKAKEIAEEHCISGIIVIFGKDCKYVWIKNLYKSGQPIINTNRMVFIRGV